MPDYTYGPAPVLVETTGEFAIGATGVLLATEGGSPVQVYDLNGSPLPGVLVGPKGAHQAFKADIPDGVLDFGSVQLPSASIEAQRAGFTALEVATAAQITAQNAVQQIADAAGAARVVIHGSNANLARPDVPFPVVWFGSVEPANADATQDVYVLAETPTIPDADGILIDGATVFADTTTLLASLAPQSMTGCLMYYAADQSGITAGSAVPTWTDLSPNGRNLTQATSAARPTLVADGVSGLPGVRFAPGTKMATATGAIPVNAAQQPATVIAAVRFLAAPAASQTLLFSDKQYLSMATNGTFYYTDGTTVGLGEINVVGEPHIMRVTRTATDVDTYLDGQLLLRTALGSNTRTWGWQLSIAPNADTALDFIISELGWYDGRTFTTTDAEQVERYLLAKYKIPAPVAATGTAARFNDSVGVNIHTSWTSPPSGFTGPAPDTNAAMLVPAVTGLGVKYVRDHSYPGSTDVRALQQALIAQGVKVGLMCPTASTGQSGDTMTAHVAQAATGGPLAGGVCHFEPANEYDFTGGSWATTMRAEQTALWNAVRAKAELNSVPVLGPSYGTAVAGATTYGEDAAHMDAANSHAYAGGRVAELAVANVVVPQSKINAPGKPFHVTEIGHHTAVNSDAAEFGVSEQAQAVYTLRSVLESFRAGSYRTFVYQLFDQWAEPAEATNARHWGLLNPDGSPKAAYTALKNMLAITADASSGTPGSLSYEIASERGVREVLLSRSNGSFDLILWRPATVWNRPPLRSDRAAPDVPTAVRFATSRNVSIYRPLLGATARATTSGTAVGFHVPADPVILRIS